MSFIEFSKSFIFSVVVAVHSSEEKTRKIFKENFLKPKREKFKIERMRMNFFLRHFQRRHEDNGDDDPPAI